MNTFQFSPGLTQLRDWAREKQEDTDVPADERALWAQIADEITDYIEPDDDVLTYYPTDDLFGGPR